MLPAHSCWICDLGFNLLGPEMDQHNIGASSNQTWPQIYHPTKFENKSRTSSLTYQDKWVSEVTYLGHPVGGAPGVRLPSPLLGHPDRMILNSSSPLGGPGGSAKAPSGGSCQRGVAASHPWHPMKGIPGSEWCRKR